MTIHWKDMKTVTFHVLKYLAAEFKFSMGQFLIKSFNKTHSATCAELNNLVSMVVKATLTSKAQDWLTACVRMEHWSCSWLFSLLSIICFNLGDHCFRESYLSPNSGNITSCTTLCWKVFVTYLLLCSLLMETFIMFYMRFPAIITCKKHWQQFQF